MSKSAGDEEPGPPPPSPDEEFSQTRSARRPYRVVASLTTLPSRYDQLRSTLASLIRQTYPFDAIYLTLPLACARLKTAYPVLPADIASQVIVVRPAVDYGPLCKIYGALMHEHEPTTRMFTFDDDVLYPPTLTKEMLDRGDRQPRGVICGTGSLIGRGLVFTTNVTNLNHSKPWDSVAGFTVPPCGRAVDLIYGVSGVLYQRGHFSAVNDMVPVSRSGRTITVEETLAVLPTAEPLSALFNHALANYALFCNDDVVLSGYLAQRGVSRYVFADLPRVQTNGKGNDALSENLIRTIRRMHQALGAAEERGLFTVYEPVGYDETILGRIVIGVALLLLLVVLVVVFVRYVSHRAPASVSPPPPTRLVIFPPPPGQISPPAADLLPPNELAPATYTSS